MVILEELVTRVREQGVAQFEKFADMTNTDKGKYMIVFLSNTLNSRKVNDWGRDEDTDIYLGLDNKGWIKYKHTIEYLAGPSKIKDTSTINLNDTDVVNYLKSEECTIDGYLSFMSKSYKIL